MRSITHKCRENDAIIKVKFKDRSIEELQVKIQGERGWIVIGYMDLQKAIATAIKKMDYVVKKQNSGGYIGEAEIENERIAQSIYSPCKYGCKNLPY